MGLIRGGLLVIVSVILFILLLIGNLLLILSVSLSYDNAKSGVISIAKNYLSDKEDINSIIKENHDSIKSYCENKSKLEFNQSGFEFEIPCEIVDNSSEAIIDYGVNNMFDDIYYKDYNCELLKCFEEEETPLFLISQKTHDYVLNKFYIALMISFILIIFMFFLIENKTNLPIVAGALLVVSSLPFIKLDWVISLVSNSEISNILAIFFSKSHTISLVILVIGIIFLLIGITLKLFNAGFKIAHLFKKQEQTEKTSKDDVKKIAKEKISKGESKAVRKK